MANNEKVPELEKILEKNFAEMKIGEEKFQQDETTEQNIPRIDKKIIYQERYSSENQTGTIIVKPISATTKVIDAPIEAVEVTEEVLEEIVEDSRQEILEKPASSIGEDFAVDW